MLKQNEMKKGHFYRDREGTVWECYQHSVYDEGWSWARNKYDGLPGFFDAFGNYAPGMEHAYDLVEEVSELYETPTEKATNDWYENGGYLAGRHDYELVKKETYQ